MRIGIDIQTTLGQKTGFGFYVSNLIKNLRQVSSYRYIYFKPQTDEDFSTLKRFWWDQVTIPRLAWQNKVDILHQPCFSAPVLYRGPIVVTVHDIISILFPQNIPFVSRMFYSRWMPFSYRNADKIIAISQNTKRDIQKILQIPEEKIRVIYLAVSDEFKQRPSLNKIQKAKQRYGIAGDYILHVGTLEPRKNLQFLVKAFFRAQKKYRLSKIKLVITGKKGWYYQGIFTLARKLKMADQIVFTGYVADQDTPLLYAGAKLFVFPSLYEGFGLPPLEAMTVGVPVISSNTSSLPEVVGKGGILLPPKKIDEWAMWIGKIIRNPTLRQNLIKAGRRQAQKFSWTTTARKTVEVYQEVYEKFHSKTKS